MAQLGRHGKKQQQFAQRKTALKRELAKREAQRTALERELRRLKNVIDDSKAGPSMVRVMPGEGRTLFLAKLVNAPVADAVSRGNTPGACRRASLTVKTRAFSRSSVSIVEADPAIFSRFSRLPITTTTALSVSWASAGAPPTAAARTAR
jgi:hypothetical protein